MGNQVSRSGGTTGKKTFSPSEAQNNAQEKSHGQSNKKAMSRTASGADIEHSTHTQFLPLDNLAKILVGLAQKEESVNGVTSSVFERYLFPRYSEFAERLFAYLHTSSKATTTHLGLAAFKQQAERFLGIMKDRTILENYIKMYSRSSSSSECCEVTPDSLRALLMTSYRLAMENYSGGSQTCLHIHRTIDAVLISCFHGKDSLSVSYVANWLSQHCPRIVQGLHRYVVHVLTTAYRNGETLLSQERSQLRLEPGTPVLEKTTFEGLKPLLPVSHAWLLSTILPISYTQAEDPPSEASGGASHALIAKMVGNACPSHWTLLYNSGQHGNGANRFLHHVLGYRGPTLLFIRGVSLDEADDCPTYCVCSAVEWRESHLYWGDEDSIVIELLPTYRVVEKGPKLLYLNTGIRGYPQGIRAGSDPRNPCVNIDQSFGSVKLAGVPYRIASLEVWGCGDRKSRERQLEIKKWQVKEAERQRVVKLSTTDWLDHPDRYLLELAGRPSYNNAGS
ncbi:uncharacterized protein LOC107273773 [Cephus cinctus]|uniref:Uncharacterized protein LOC107273773 n=1 Tax=Cephus cinctus TaxID=211228 RepID=A0AAJ7CDE5_CEPCN|nr:uncharacterized protein LOC107273773 [Cephus cinctus]